MRLKGIVIIVLLTSQTGISLGARSFENPPSFIQTESANVEFVSAAELKTKVAQKQPVTIIDVRTTDSFADSNRKIKGAVHVKLRRLRYRLGFPPLNAVSRDSEVVTYCACPNDELSIKAVEVLRGSGFKRAKVLKGGWREWLKLNGPVESVPK